MTSDFKENSFEIATSWLVTILCIIYGGLSVYFTNPMTIIPYPHILGICIVYIILLLIIYWVLNSKQKNNLKNLFYNSMGKETDSIKKERSKFNNFKKLMLILSNVPFLYLIYVGVYKYKASKKIN